MCRRPRRPTFSYDNAERLHQVTTTNNGAYVRHEYGPNYIQHFSTVNNLADDSFAMDLLDGVGRVYLSSSYHPRSQGGYKAVWTQFDAMGRVMKQSNPTEILWNWSPYGDDAAGWYFTQQTDDWKGRPLVTTNPY